MELTYSPSALPGSCYFCGSGNREFYIDTNLSVEFHGAMYICNLCGNELALLMRYISHDEYKELKRQNESAHELVYQLRVKLDAAEEALRGLVNAGYRYDNGDVIRSGGALLETVPGTEGAVSTGADELGEGEGTSSESSDDEDVGELRSDDTKPDAIFGFLGQGPSEGDE